MWSGWYTISYPAIDDETPGDKHTTIIYLTNRNLYGSQLSDGLFGKEAVDAIRPTLQITQFCEYCALHVFVRTACYKIDGIRFRSSDGEAAGCVFRFRFKIWRSMPHDCQRAEPQTKPLAYEVLRHP
jgi:hypothetical protein